MSVGNGLLYTLLKEKRPLSFLQEHRMDRDAFEGNEKKVFDAIYEHVANHGILPQLRTVERESKVRLRGFPDEPIGYWIDGVEKRFQSALILSAAKGMREGVAGGDIDEARNAARDLILGLDLRSPVDRVYDMVGEAGSVLEAHDSRQISTTLKGVPFGFDYLDSISDGAQPSDTIAFVGRPGVGKTYFMLVCALFAYLKGYVPLVVSLEMSVFQCVRRLVALHSHVPTTLVRLGRLGYWGRDKLVRGITQLRGTNRQPFYIIQGALTSTVEDLPIRIQELKPDIVYVDGAYLLRTTSGTSARWERVTECAEYLKMIAREFDIPVVGSYQFNRRGPGSLGNIGYSDAIGQLASIVCGIEDEGSKGDSQDSQWELLQYKLLRLLKGREGEKGTLRILFDMGRMMIEQDSVLKGQPIDENTVEYNDPGEYRRV